jgi:hypothetical protein
MLHPSLFTKETPACAAIVGLSAFLGWWPIPAFACEPLPPLLVLFVAPSLMGGPVMGWLRVVVGLVVGIGMKSAVFVYFEPAFPHGGRWDSCCWPTS